MEELIGKTLTNQPSTQGNVPGSLHHSVRPSICGYYLLLWQLRNRTPQYESIIFNVRSEWQGMCSILQELEYWMWRYSVHPHDCCAIWYYKYSNCAFTWTKSQMHSHYRCLWPLLVMCTGKCQGAAQRRGAFTELPHGQLCAICSQKRAWLSSRSEQTGLDGGIGMQKAVHSTCVKGGILFHTIVRACLWIRAHQMCVLYSPGLTRQTICLVSVRSFDFKTVWIKTLRALINLACAWV